MLAPNSVAILTYLATLKKIISKFYHSKSPLHVVENLADTTVNKEFPALSQTQHSSLYTGLYKAIK